MKINKFYLRGEELKINKPSDITDDSLQLQRSYTIKPLSRGDDNRLKIEVADDEVVELVFDDQTTWICNSDTIDEIFPDALVINRDGEQEFELPVSISSDDAERGLGDVVMKAVNIFKNKLAGKAVAEAVKILVDKLEDKLMGSFEGWYRVDTNFQYLNTSSLEEGKPILLFLHGTAASAEASFKDLVGSPAWTFIHEQYGKNVTAFQHRTLSRFPLESVLNLVKELPAHATIHIISQSGGGLVAELLSRFCNSDEKNRGLTKSELEVLKKEYPAKVYKKNVESAVDAITKELKTKKITIQKFIRVACPAGGSILASKRLDMFMNVLMNLVGSATGSVANPVYLAFKSLVAGVINCKNDPEILPGVEVLNPKSPFMKALNNRHETVALNNPLTVISGNANVKLNLKSLVIIASKLFFMQDNDLIVNTRSMYKGTKRTGLAQYFFTEGNEVNHFNYFKNEKSREAILLALKSPDNVQVPGFKLLTDVTMDAERNALLKLEMGQVFTDTVTGKKPIVVLLPGIMGSNLSHNDKLLWINYFKILGGEVSKLHISNSGVDAPSLIRTSYKQLVDHLSGQYDVVTYPFDWRLQLNTLAAKFNDKIIELMKHKQPIRIIGHSMGGVLVRDFILQHPDTWDKLNKSPKFRLIFLGSPLGGSFRIPAVLFGKDGIIDKLSMIDIAHTKKELLQVFSQFPGILSLLPHDTDADHDFSNNNTWHKLKSGVDDDWPLPTNADLNTFKKYRDQILQKKTQIDYSNMVYIAGKDKATPCGYRIQQRGDRKDLEFLYTAEGDQSVTWATGIPKEMIQQNAVYYVNVTHGALANEPTMFKGISEILEKGFTTMFSKSKPQVRGGDKPFVAPESFDFDLTAEGVENTILGLGTREELQPTETPLHVSVTNGDLRFAQYPLLAGHFLKDGIVSSEKAIDQLLNGALSERLKLGLYPGLVGTSEILITSGRNFKGVILAGLGDQDKFTAFQLTGTIEQAVSKYLLNLSDRINNGNAVHSGKINISSLIVGCGYGGLSIENAVRAILQGVQNANRKIRKLDGQNHVSVDHVEFIEQYEDRSLSCFYALSRLERDVNQSLNITLEPRRINAGIGSKTRLPIEITDRWWNRINVKLREEKDSKEGIKCLLFNSSTNSAREEQRELYSTIAIIEQLVEEASVDKQWSPDLAKTIFELLVPNDFKEQFKRRGHINWILEKETASYPWELLQDSSSDEMPFCVNAGMIRQLATDTYRQDINPVMKDNALIIGDPELHGFLPQLNGAAQEANLVSSLLQDRGYGVVSDIGGKAHQIIRKLFSDDYKIIHLAGHGIFDPAKPAASGMVIGNGVYLSTREIHQMSTVPELVFVNCCFLGQMNADAELYYRNRYKLAANIGVQLIEIGVKAVIVAGWAVADNAAKNFADEFYKAMFNGDTFGEAVLSARKSTYGKFKADNTWGAYQCYGDPFYRLTQQSVSKKTSKQYIIPQEAMIDLDNLYHELELGHTMAELEDRLKMISTAVDEAAIRTAAITQREADIWAGLYRYDLAITKIEEAFRFEEATFTVKLLEDYCDYRSKQCVIDFQKGIADRKSMLQQIDRVISDLTDLLKIRPTAERYAILGSAYKRKIRLSGTAKEKLDACEKAVRNYEMAHSLNRGPQDIFTDTNMIILKTVLQILHPVTARGGKKVKVKPVATDAANKKIIAQLEAVLQDQSTGNIATMDFRNIVKLANIRLCMYVLHKNKMNLEQAVNAYKEVLKLAGSTGKKQWEIEQLDILTDLLHGSKHNRAIELSEGLVQLRSGLKDLL